MIRPREPMDLMLAPVAVEIDMNLERLRTLGPVEIEADLQLELDAPLILNTRAERADRIVRVAIRNVDLHGWVGEINEDASSLILRGGSATIHLALSPTLRRYVEVGLE